MNRLVQEIPGTPGQGFLGVCFDICSGEDNYRDSRKVGGYEGDDVKSTHFRHAQVYQYQIDRVLLDALQTVPPVSGSEDRIPHVFQIAGQASQKYLFIVDNQNGLLFVGFHDYILFIARGSVPFDVHGVRRGLVAQAASGSCAVWS